MRPIPLFRNAGKGNFVDATLHPRVGPLTLRHSGWGLGLFDFNNDGWKDLFTANSHVNDRVEQFEAAVYQEAEQRIRQRGRACFRTSPPKRASRW